MTCQREGCTNDVPPASKGRTAHYCSWECRYPKGGGPSSNGFYHSRYALAVCQVCGATFTPTVRSKGRFCSYECYGKSRHLTHPKTRERREALRPYPVGQWMKRHRVPREMRLQWMGLNHAGQKRRPTVSACITCGVLVLQGHIGATLKYCPPCRRAAQKEQSRAWSRTAKRRRKSLAKGKPYRDRDIFERDGYRCHFRRTRQCIMSRAMCRPDADRMLDDWAPTIDHLIPLAVGGEDTPENVACAHRKCNWHWRHLGTSQLMLLVA